MYYGRPYVSKAKRQDKAARSLGALQKKGQAVAPVVLSGRAIARTFWGKAWCDNLERYSDYSNRLPRGRAYVRNGSVIDLRIEAGRVHAKVSGSRLYKVEVEVKPLIPSRWEALCADCVGGIDSMVELLQGRFSAALMERMCARGTGLFPEPLEIKFGCTCPDWAGLCKHIAATLYGVGARLDVSPELLFSLRQVDKTDLMVKVGGSIAQTKIARNKVLGVDDLSELFGLELSEEALPLHQDTQKTPRPSPTAASKAGKTLVRSKGLIEASSSAWGSAQEAGNTDRSRGAGRVKEKKQKPLPTKKGRPGPKGGVRGA